MPKLTRKTGKLFGENANPSSELPQGPEIGQFGSALAATYIGTTDIDTIQALPAWGQGFIGAVTPTNQYPPLPEMTGFGKVLSYQTNYLLQTGLAEWDSGTTYYANSFCQLDGIVYISNTNQNLNNNPVNDRVNWRIFENGGRSHNLFDIVIKDHVLSYEDTLGFTIQGGWAYKEAEAGVHYGYPDFYAKCIAEKEAGTQTRITLGSNQIDVWINDNGHIYFDVADRTIVDTYYNSTGIAWFYGIDETNERILMPRNDYYFKMATQDPGEYNAPSAPSISHNHTFSGTNKTGYAYCLAKPQSQCDGNVFTNTGIEASYGDTGAASSSKDYRMNFSYTPSGTIGAATNANGVYSNSDNQIIVSSANAVLYIVTGNTVDESAQTINASLQDAIDALEEQEQTSIGNIGDAETDVLGNISDAKDDAIQDIQDETATVIQDATEQADRAESEADRAEAAADVAVAGQMQADWTQNDPTKVDYIKNKPTNLVTETGIQTLTNKTIDADDNTISNLTVSNINQSAISSIIDTTSPSPQKLTTEAAVAGVVGTIEEQINQIQIAKNPNLAIIGDLTVNNGNISGYTDSDYLQFPYVWNFGNYSWTLQIQFTTSNDVTTQQNIIDSYYGIALAINNAKFVLAISSNGSSWDIANSSTGSYTVEANTTYTLKLSWDGTDYVLAYSEDEETFTDDITVTSSTIHNATQEYVGGSPNLFGAGTAKPFDGTINLNKWSLTVNDLLVWLGMDDVGLSSRANVSLNNLDALGEARFTNCVKRLSLNSATGSTSQAVYVDAGGQVQVCTSIPQSLYQTSSTLSSGTIALDNQTVIYKLTPSAATTLTFDTTNVDTTKVITFELCIDMSTAYSITFPASVSWQDATAPDLSQTGTYFLAFRTIDGGTTWFGNLQGKW